jgi:hypothetical protein
MSKNLVGFGFTFEDIDFKDLIDFDKHTFLPAFIKDYLYSLRLKLSNISDATLFGDEALFTAEVLIDYSWEMLNTNIWVFVEDIWRLIYAFSTLYKAIILNGKIEKENRKEDDLIKLCDLGLLMSGPLLQPKFNQIIQYLRPKPEISQGLEEPPAKIIKLDSKELDSKFMLKVEESPGFEYFNSEYMVKKIPVIIDNQMNHWPAMKKWRLVFAMILNKNVCYDFKQILLAILYTYTL